MKIGLIAHGELPVPPRDWGAVEGTIWCYKNYLERLGHQVDIANTRSIHEVIYHANQRRYDFVHCHNELFTLECVAHLRRPYAVTAHYGGLHRFVPERPESSTGFQYLFEDLLQVPASIALSEHIRQQYLRSGYRGYLRVLRNAVEVEQFRCEGQGNGKAVCVGVISARKRQAWLAEIARGRVTVDFVGPRLQGQDGGFAEHETARHIGLWTKQTLYDQLTNYSCLVLLSDSESAVKVVLEAFAAGLSVVVSEGASANLTDEPFITVIPDEERRPEVIAQHIQTAIDNNPGQRDAIRQYAKDRFDYQVVIPEYVEIVEEIREYFATHGDEIATRSQSPLAPPALIR